MTLSAPARPLFLILALLLLTGCSGMAFSPEAAAVQNAAENNMPGFTVDSATIQVLQKVEVGQTTLIMTSFTGMRAETGREQCLFLSEAVKSRLGTWVIGSGGGSCTNARRDPAAEPIWVGSNSSSGGSPEDPGYSAVNGLVFRDDIAAVQVTWNDGMVHQAEVVNSSYLAAREGQFTMTKAEALNADGAVVYTNEPLVAPGKRE